MKRKKRFGDRKDGRLLRSLSPMDKVSPFIMPHKAGATNYCEDEVDITAMNHYIHEKRRQGLEGFGTMHLLVAAYVRTVTQRPGVNRFVSGQCVYARNNIEVMLTIKREMALNAPETIISVVFPPESTAEDVFRIFQTEIEKARTEDGDFDKTAAVINYIPRPIKYLVVCLLHCLDYFGWLPKFLTDLSPFHGSIFLTSMSSLGIPPVYHHLYNFGNVPAFMSFGRNEKRYELNSKGEVKEVRYMRYTIALDDRICDGYYYASALRLFKSYLKNPYLLDVPPEEIVEDID